MRKIILAASTAIAAIGYSHGRSETVLVKGGKDGPIRVNKSDFDADQEGDKKMSLYTGKDGENEAPAGGGTSSDVNLTNAGGVQTTAAPSAPNFSGPTDADPLPMDPVKNAAAPAATTSDELLVMKSGKKFYICDGLGNKVTGDRAKLLGVDETGYDSEEAAKRVQTTTEPKPTP